jgi:uncharacterized protein
MTNQRHAQENRIDYIEFPTTDIAQTKAFYNKVFGWTFQDWGPDYISFNDGRLDGGFTRHAAVGGHFPLIVFYAPNLEAKRQAIQQAGGKIVKEIFEFPGGIRFHFTDPSGNVLAVWSEKS